MFIVRSFLLCCLLCCSFSHSVNAEQAPIQGLFVAGYFSKLSYLPGEEVGLHLSSSAQSVSIVIERVGVTNERVFQRDGLVARVHPVPDRASSEGCGWPVSLLIPVERQWKSGYYQATLTATNEDEAKPARAQMFFVVRSATPGRQTKILLQLSTNTYNAYTNWGGHSLYSYHDRDGLQGHQVSFERPLNSQFFNWEIHFVKWAEERGYVLDYAVNSDLEFHPELLPHYNLVLSVGHDEYWSALMRDNLEAYIARGGNVAFFSGNTCCWQVRSEAEGRALTCWKQAYVFDPLYRTSDHKLLSTAWGHHLIQRPENELTGVGFLWGGYHRSHGQFMDGSGAYTVHRPEHWVFTGTQVKKDDLIGGADTVVGYECDGCEMVWKDGLPFPTHKDGTPEGFTIIGTCPARWAAGDCYWYDRFPKDRVGAAVMGLYQKGGTVFTCGSTDWAHGLRGKDPVVSQITKNILDRLSQRPAQAVQD